MVDKAIFVSSGGTDALMRRMEVLTNNLANATTPGFRADFTTSKQTKAGSGVKSSRLYSSVGSTWSDFSHGPVTATGRDLDVAISGEGMLAVQSRNGKEGYTRAGNLHVRNGFLVTGAGHLVLGIAGGVIPVPEDAVQLKIAEDGSVSVKIRGGSTESIVGRMKLVNPEIHELDKGDDGLLYPKGNGSSFRMNEKVRLMSGALEGSNVNTVKALTDLVELSRQFEMQSRLMKSVQENAEKANQVMSLPV